MAGINLEKIKKVNLKRILSGMGSFWRRIYRPLLFIFWLGMLGWTGYFWYVTIYDSRWIKSGSEVSPGQASQDVNLDKKSLERVILEVELRRKGFENPDSYPRDIFKKY